MIPKVVVFDLGKVLLNFDYGIAIKRLQTRCKISTGELRGLIDQSPLLYRYETNLLSSEQFFAEIQASSGFCGDFAEFGEMFADIFSPIKPMVRLHRDLCARKIPTYIFSNTNDLAVRHIRDRFSFFQKFHGHILSYEHNAMKPDPRIYQIVERCTGHNDAALLYIDDRPENISAGMARGWQTILHETPARTRAAVRKTGLVN